MLNKESKENLKKKQTVYFSRIIPNIAYDVCELSIRTLEDNYFVGTDKRDKHAYLLPYDSLNKTVFTNRKDALDVVCLAEKEKKVLKDEYYEEY